ncbi:SdrD B-like domain-containing protein, partial [Luteimonas sp. FXH3W]
ANNNGVREAGENGIAGVSISLPAGTVDALGNAVAAVVTDANGDYRFDDLLAGTYTVSEQVAQPVVGGYTTSNGITVAGTVGGSPSGTATPVTTVPSAVAGIVLPAGGASIDNDFGEILVAAITGSVYVDRNGNGDFDAGDAGTNNSRPNGGLQDVTLTLTGAGADGIFGNGDDPAPVVLQTDANGAYQFTGLVVGQDYRITETQPQGYGNGIEHPTNVIEIGNLPLAGTSGHDFGEVLGSLAGVVFEDFSATSANN